MAKYFVTVGKKAHVFHDPVTGLTIAKGEVKELTSAQVNSKRIKSALNGGHLVYTQEVKPAIEKPSELNPETLVKKFSALVEKGLTVDKLKDKFTLEELKAIAKENEIEPEENDTKEDLIKALLEE